MAKRIQNAFERFRSLTKRIIAVPKPEIDKREAEYKKQRIEKKTHSSKEA
jgi:hypothetical protein